MRFWLWRSLGSLRGSGGGVVAKISEDLWQSPGCTTGDQVAQLMLDDGRSWKEVAVQLSSQSLPPQAVVPRWIDTNPAF